MVEVQLQVCSTNTMQEDKNLKVSDNLAPPPPPPPPHQRRPRVREVSSRFMSPAVSSVQRRQRSESDNDENSETPFPLGCSVSQRKQRAMKLFKETTNGVVEQVPHPSKSCSSRIGFGIGGSNNNTHNSNNATATATPCVSRPDTPTPSISVSSRYRFTPHHHNHHHNHHRSINGSASAAAKLFQSSGISSLVKANAASSSSSSSSALPHLDSKSHDDSSISCSIQSLPELCSQNDRDMLLQPTVSTGSMAEKTHPSPLSRSVSLPSSGSEHLLVKGAEKQPHSLSKHCGNGNQSNHVKLGGLSLPPVPPQCAKPGLDTRKAKKGSSHQEDVHSLRLIYNRYLQWRFANAKANSVMKAQQTECEKALYSHATKISEMRDSVNRKRIELELLRRSKTLSTILEAQIPHLDEWSAMEEDYSVSITEAIQALLNASVQLPVGGNVRVDVREVGEVLNSALKMMETIVSNIQRFMPKAEETDISISELAGVVGGERALIGECGDLLSKTYKSQVEECSLRGQLIQLHSICHKKKNEE